MKYSRGFLLLPLLLLSLTPLLWFWGRGDVLINGVDTNFPLNPLIWFQRRFFVWDAISNAGHDFSSSTAGLFFHLIQVIPYGLGLTLQTTEIINLIFWFSAIVFSSYFFAKTIFPKSLLVQLLFVVFYSFNVYLFNTWENVKVANLSMVSAIPLVITILIRLREERITKGNTAALAVLAGALASGAGLNPAYFSSFLLAIFLLFISQIVSSWRWQDLKNLVKNYLFVLFFVFGINLFWILPTANFLIKNIGPTGSISTLGFVNWVGSLSENTSLLNIIRLQGAWDWYAKDGLSGLPLYIPYALNYFNSLPFLAFSFLLPALAFIGLITAFIKRKAGSGDTYLYVAFGIMLTLGIFLGAGTHEPTGIIFRFLSDTIPFFTLFRSPWYTFTPIVTLSTAGLIGLFFYNLLDWARERRNNRVLLGVYLSAAILIIGNFLYNYPLVDGKIFRPDRHDSFFVSFPDYVFAAGNRLSGEDGRVIGYPDDEIENYTWGYRGIESVVGLVSDREVLFSSLNLTTTPVAGLIREFYYNLKRGQLSSVKNLADKLNVSLLLEKRDQKSLALDLPEDISKLFSTEFGKWKFYKLADFLPKIYTAENVFYVYPYHRGAKAMATLVKKDILVNPEDTEVAKIRNISQAGHIIVAENSQKKEFENFINSPSQLSNRLLLRDLSRVDFTFDIPADGVYELMLERYRLEEFGIRIDDGLDVELNGAMIRLEVSKTSDSYLYFEKTKFLKGAQKISLKLNNENLIVDGDFQNDASFKKGGYGEGEAKYETLEVDSEKFLSIINIGKADVSADFSPTSFNPLVPYYISLKYKQIYGNNASSVIRQETPSTLVKAQTERMPNYPEWGVFSFYYDPVKTESSVKISLSSPFTKDPLGTKVFYDDLAVFKVFTNELLLIEEGSNFLNVPEVNFDKVSPVFYKARVSRATGPHMIVFSENYDPQWQFSTKPEFSMSPIHFSTNTYANAWYVQISPETYEIEIFYTPQNFFQAGSYFSLATALGGLVLLIRERIKNGKVV